MANTMYTKALEAFLTAKINWEFDVIKAVLIDTDSYTPNFSSHEFLSDIPLAARIAESPALAAKTASNGVADASDVVFPGVTGSQCEAIVLFKAASTPNAARLICFIDTAAGLPVTPVGSDVSIVWDDGINKIFRL